MSTANSIGDRGRIGPSLGWAAISGRVIEAERRILRSTNQIAYNSQQIVWRRTSHRYMMLKRGDCGQTAPDIMDDDKIDVYEPVTMAVPLPRRQTAGKREVWGIDRGAYEEHKRQLSTIVTAKTPLTTECNVVPVEQCCQTLGGEQRRLIDPDIVRDMYVSTGPNAPVASLMSRIIGLSDGLTVPFALTAGLSFIGSSRLVVTGGLAELCAGAISMGVGGFCKSGSYTVEVAAD